MEVSSPSQTIAEYRLKFNLILLSFNSTIIFISLHSKSYSGGPHSSEKIGLATYGPAFLNGLEPS